MRSGALLLNAIEHHHVRSEHLALQARCRSPLCRRLAPRFACYLPLCHAQGGGSLMLNLEPLFVSVNAPLATTATTTTTTTTK